MSRDAVTRKSQTTSAFNGLQPHLEEIVRQQTVATVDQDGGGIRTEYSKVQSSAAQTSNTKPTVAQPSVAKKTERSVMTPSIVPERPSKAKDLPKSPRKSASKKKRKVKERPLPKIDKSGKEFKIVKVEVKDTSKRTMIISIVVVVVLVIVAIAIVGICVIVFQAKA